jgi:hypothetical protein
MVTPFIAACISSLTTIATMSANDPLPPPRDELDASPSPCSIAIVLVRSDGSLVSRTIDAMTGGYGFSHVYVDPCRVNAQGESMVVGYSPRLGVHWQRAADYKPERVHVRVELDERTGAELWGCVRTRFGRPLKIGAIAMGLDSAGTCVGLVVGCLPMRLQDELRKLQIGPCISPNTLAAYYGLV